jgi:hypothetical protein
MSKYSVGLRNVGSYMVSGQPYITGSAVNAGDQIKIEFPFVTKNVTIRIPSPPNAGRKVYYYQAGGSVSLYLITADNKHSAPLYSNFGGGTSDMAVSFWLKGSFIRGLQLGRGFKANNGFTNQVAWTLRHVGGSNYALTLSGLSGGNIDHPTVVTDGEWHHILITQNGGSCFIYVDGNAASLSSTGNMNGDINVWTFGWNGAGGAQDVDYDELAMFNTGFSQSDVDEIYNNGEWFDPRKHSKSANLFSWIPLGDNVNDIAQDYGSDGTGTIVGIPLVYDNLDSSKYMRPIFLHDVGVPDAISGSTGPFTKQSTGKLRVHMLSTGSASGANIVTNSHYRELQGYGTTITLPMKTKELYLSAVDAQTTFEVIAELTNIPTNSMYALTGSGIDE